MVANLSRGQLNREDVFFPVPVRASELGLARQVRRPAPLNLALLAGFHPLSAMGVRLFIPSLAIGYVSSFIGSRNCVPMVLTAESPLAQGQ